MTDSETIDDLAAEFVLGTLNADERRAVMARRTREPDLEDAIVFWETRFAPLDDVMPPVTPPSGLKAHVLRAIQLSAATPEPAPAENVVFLRRRIARWRTAALGASALAACLAGVIVVRETLRPVTPKSYVAVLQKDAQSPAFLMTVDIDNRSFTVRPVAAEVRPGKSYELWIVSQKLGAPRSLGVVGDQPFSVSPRLAGYASGDIENATYAVSVEPEGGSPTGAPTGPVVYAGKLVQAQP